METAGKGEIPDDAERQGIGTPATRDMKATAAVDFKYNYVYYKYKQMLIDGNLHGIAHPKGFLFDEDFNLTDVRAKDLPDSYIYGIYEKGVGYLDSFGATGLKYIPGPFKDFPKNDVLLVSYKLLFHAVKYKAF